MWFKPLRNVLQQPTGIGNYYSICPTRQRPPGIPTAWRRRGLSLQVPSAAAQAAILGLGADSRPEPLNSRASTRATTEARPSFCGGCRGKALGRWGRCALGMPTQKKAESGDGERPHPLTVFRSSWAPSQTSSGFSITRAAFLFDTYINMN